MKDIRRLNRTSLGRLVFPESIPADPEEVLDLMDDAARHASTAQGTGAPAFDQGMLIFNQLKAHCDLHVSRELGAAHVGLKRATIALKIATWWLAIITFLLGGIELWKFFRDH
jgi:hypothetical protein